ncbi:MAG: hypothetical protein K2Q18_10170 [Bdellovibrionales bacterium]|nr:hypothetical protein [Bdellovibrionales bacterium]
MASQFLYSEFNSILNSSEVKKKKHPEFMEFLTGFDISNMLHELLENQKRSSMAGYLNGHKYENSYKLGEFFKIWKKESSLDSLNDLPCSVKFSNLEFSVKSLWDLTSRVSSLFNWQYYLSCNLYITPSQDKDCFLFHADPSEAIIAQIYGEKKWYFVTEKENFSYDLKVPNLTFFQNSVIEYEVNKNEYFCVPKGMIHRASNQMLSPSLHITFSLNTEFTHVGLKKILKKHDLNYAYDDSLHFVTLDSKDLTDILTSFPQVNLLQVMDDLRMENMHQFKNARTPFFTLVESI